MSTVTVDGGPVIELNVDAFIDDQGNTTTDADVPVWTAVGNDASGNALATLVAPSPNGGPQSAQLTISKKVGALQVNAAFGDQSKLGSPGNYLLSGALNITPGLAVSGTIEMTGPGVTNP